MDARLRKLPALLVAFALVAALAVGCATEDEGDDTSDTVDEAPTTDVKVAMVTDVGGLDDKSFNDLAYAGLQTAEQELGVEIKVLVPNGIEEYEPKIDQLAQSGYDIIFTVGHPMADTTQKMASEYPDVAFGGIDQFFAEPADNQLGLLYKANEGAYLAGVVAGLATLDTGMDERINDANTIAFIGGEDIPRIEEFEVGFTAGARSVNPDVQVISLYARSFVDQAKGKELALTAIEQGADIVFAAAEQTGLGAITACREAGALFIGVDVDQYETVDEAKPIIITSALKRIDVAVYQVIEDVVNGTFAGGANREFGLEDDIIALAPFHEFEDEISQDIRDAIETAEQDVLDGTVEVPSNRDEL